MTILGLKSRCSTASADMTKKMEVPVWGSLELMIIFSFSSLYPMKKRLAQPFLPFWADPFVCQEPTASFSLIYKLPLQPLHHNHPLYP